MPAVHREAPERVPEDILLRYGELRPCGAAARRRLRGGAAHSRRERLSAPHREPARDAAEPGTAGGFPRGSGPHPRGERGAPAGALGITATRELGTPAIQGGSHVADQRPGPKRSPEAG